MGFELHVTLKSTPTNATTVPKLYIFYSGYYPQRHVLWISQHQVWPWTSHVNPTWQCGVHCCLVFHQRSWGKLHRTTTGCHAVHGSNMTSLKIALPDSSDPCQPYYIWVAGFVSNGQRGPYSKRRRVEMGNRAEGMMHKTQYYTVIDDLVSFSLAKYLFWPIREEQFDSADEFHNVVTLGILGGLVHVCRYWACCCEDCVRGHGVEKVEKGQ